GAIMIGMAGSVLTVAAFAAFVVLDAAAGFSRRGEIPDPPARKPNLRPFWIGLAISLYLGLVAAFWFLVGRYVMHGVLVTWTLLALGFALLLRFAIVGRRAPETWLAAPADHRVHERRVEDVADPQRARAERVLAALRARGDATGFLEVVREAARSADLPDDELRDLEARIVASFARAGTRRDQDIHAALGEIERALLLRSERAEIPIQRSPQETPS
ncbi:MAG TPA: hypothetical protein VHH36_03315, partial [Candidatus Thermoplasmatota archaeon]|nr:hypothetical protein [Candidatus Thermoplasmatota archaeon]